MSSLRRKAIEGIKPGDSITIERTFSEEDVMRFGDVSRDYNPVHYDERYAGAKGFPRIICHGLLVASMITESGGQLGWLATRMDFRFKKPVYMGEMVRCTLTITDVDESGMAESQAVWRNQEGEILLEATLTGFPPNGEQIEVMKAMVKEGDPSNKLAE
jgi:acyl dehydratase